MRLGRLELLSVKSLALESHVHASATWLWDRLILCGSDAQAITDLLKLPHPSTHLHGHETQPELQSHCTWTVAATQVRDIARLERLNFAYGLGMLT